MLVAALHNGTDKVMILHIAIGNPKDCAEITIVYCDAFNGTIGHDTGNAEVFDNFVITE